MDGYLFTTRENVMRMRGLPGNAKQALLMGALINDQGGMAQYAYHKDECGVVDVKVYDLKKLMIGIQQVVAGMPNEPITPGRSQIPPWAYAH